MPKGVTGAEALGRSGGHPLRAALAWSILTALIRISGWSKWDRMCPWGLWNNRLLPGG